MIKVDLITGFLGSGKTTFIKKYAKFREAEGEKIGIIENDFGAINVDMMLLEDLQADNCVIEQVVGGSNRDEWCRRFKSKLIAMSLRGLNRVIVEPSGIFEPEWFFDVLFMDEISERYTIDNCIALVNGSSGVPADEQMEYLVACQIAAAETIIVTKSEYFTDEKKKECKTTLVELARRYKINKPISPVFGEYKIDKNLFNGFCSDDIQKKHFSVGESLETFFVMGTKKEATYVEQIIPELFDKEYGDVRRVKGFFKDEVDWVQINATPEKTEISRCNSGQEILIVIGKQLNKEKIKNLL